jgi:type I restriction enzyme S subunit
MVGWRECTLGDVIELKRGNDLPQNQRKPGESPIISSSGVSGSHVEVKIKGERQVQNLE